jgi:hypothetical protein
LTKELWNLEVGCSIEISSHIIPIRGHPEAFEEVPAIVLAATTVPGKRIIVKRIIASLCKLPITNQFGSQYWVHGIKQPGPIVFTMNLTPPLSEPFTCIPVIVIIELLFFLFFLELVNNGGETTTTTTFVVKGGMEKCWLYREEVGF